MSVLTSPTLWLEGLARERFIPHAPWSQEHIAIWLYTYMAIGTVCYTLYTVYGLSLKCQMTIDCILCAVYWFTLSSQCKSYINMDHRLLYLSAFTLRPQCKHWQVPESMVHGIFQRLHWALSVKWAEARRSNGGVKRERGLARERFIRRAPWSQEYIAIWLYTYMAIGTVCCTL